MNSAQQLAALQQQWGTAQFSQNWVSQDWNYYDMAGYPQAGTNSLSFFSVPAGGTDPGLGVTKKKEQTNLATSNQIGGDECFVVTHLRAFVLNSAKVRQTVNATGVATDASFAARQLLFAQFLIGLLSQGSLVWTILQKKYLIENVPFQRFAAGFGLGIVVPPSVGGTAAINGGANAYASDSNADIDGGRIGDPFSLGQPVFLAPNTTFTMNINFNLGNSPAATDLYGASANQPATVWTGIILQGWKVRPRQ